MNIRYPIYEGVYRILTYNPRKHFDEASLAELAESIRQQGVLQPIGVRPIVDTDRFEIIFGERRYRAALWQN